MPTLKDIIEHGTNDCLEALHPEFADATKLKTRFTSTEQMSFVNHKFPQNEQTEDGPDIEDSPWKIIGDSTLFGGFSGAEPVNFGSFSIAGELDDILAASLAEAATLTQWYRQSDIDKVGMDIMTAVTRQIDKFVKHWGQMAVARLGLERRILAIFSNTDRGWGFISYFKVDEMGEPEEVICCNEQYLTEYLNKMAKSISGPIIKKYARCQAVSGTIQNNPALFANLRPHLLSSFHTLESAVTLVTEGHMGLPAGPETEAPAIAPATTPGETPDDADTEGPNFGLPETTGPEETTGDDYEEPATEAIEEEPDQEEIDDSGF